MDKIRITPITEDDYPVVVAMVEDLLREIMDKINMRAFNFDPVETLMRVRDLVPEEKYWVFLAKDVATKKPLGFISLYESYALYAEGAFGTIPELFVVSDFRSRKIGKALLQQVIKFAKTKGWSRLEVTTPPLPYFDKTLEFYTANDFEISGGRKLKIDIQQNLSS